MNRAIALEMRVRFRLLGTPMSSGNLGRMTRAIRKLTGYIASIWKDADRNLQLAMQTRNEFSKMQ
jgi:hypothetical protein